MNVEAIVTIIVLGVTALGGLIVLLVALFRGEIKKYIQEKMIEAEESGKSGEQKLKFVIEAVKQKYKIPELIINIKKFVESIIDITKKINTK